LKSYVTPNGRYSKLSNQGNTEKPKEETKSHMPFETNLGESVEGKDLIGYAS